MERGANELCMMSILSPAWESFIVVNLFTFQENKDNAAEYASVVPGAHNEEKQKQKSANELI